MTYDPDTLKTTLSVLNNEQVKNVLSPVTKQIGQDILSIYRLVTGDNFANIRAKLAEKRSGKPDITAEGFKRIVPLLQFAALQSDETLQDRWANLMGSAIDEKEGYMPSFGQTLAQVSAEEAQYMDRLWEFFSQPLDYTSQYPPAMWPVEDTKLINVYDPGIHTGVNATEIQGSTESISESDKANYKKLLHAQLLIENLIRLGILERKQRAEIRDQFRFKDRAIPIKNSPTILKSEYSLTHYGVSFICAVTSK